METTTQPQRPKTRQEIVEEWFARYDAQAPAGMYCESIVWPQGYAPNATPTPLWKPKKGSK